jgi:hypothetical protein
MWVVLKACVRVSRVVVLRAGQMVERLVSVRAVMWGVSMDSSWVVHWETLTVSM